MYVSRRRRRHAMGLAAILGVGVIALAPLGPAQATTPLGAQTRVSVTGLDGDATVDANNSSVAHNPAANQYLIVWQSGPETGESEIIGRLVDAAGTPLGAEFAVSDMGPPLGAGFEAETPAVAYNSRRNEYLVVWRGDDDAGPLVDGEFEIFAQRLTAGGDEVGANDRRISTMGPNGDTAYSAEGPAVAYDPTSDQYLVAWEGDDDAGLLVDEED
jgi:large repetitive protein